MGTVEQRWSLIILPSEVWIRDVLQVSTAARAGGWIFGTRECVADLQVEVLNQLAAYGSLERIIAAFSHVFRQPDTTVPLERKQVVQVTLVSLQSRQQ